MDFKKYICPACNEIFTEDDDVVVCPECGTPHHRNCYLKEGNCFNSHLHASAEDLKSSYTVKDQEDKKQKEIIDDEEERFTLPGEKTSDNDSVFPKPEFIKTLTEQINSSPGSTNLIDGKPGVYYEIAVKINQRYYIPRFINMDESGKKISVNMIALIAPIGWAIYRKMYKLAAVMLALFTVFFSLIGYYVYNQTDVKEKTISCYEEDPEFSVKISKYLTERGEGVLTPKQQELIDEMNNIQLPGALAISFMGVIFISRILMGLFGNYLYMKKIKRTIDKGEALGLRGESLKGYIYRKNGTGLIFIAATIGFFEFYYLSNFFI